MSVSGLSSSSGASSTDWQSKFKQVKADFKALSDALNSGNVSAAQTAYTQLQKDMPQKAQQANSTGSTANDPMSALGQALQSGNLAGAQQAFAAMQQARHGHHHGGSPGAAAAPTNEPAAGNDGDADDADDATGSLLNTTA